MITSTDIFRNDGPLSRNLDDYVHRDEQEALAIKIEEAINNEVSLVCEAGTGTGKTYAYLVPAILSGKKAIISTGTKHLQDQLYQKDLPIINRSLGAAVNTALLKGRNNYLCKLRLLEYEQNGSLFKSKDQYRLQMIRTWHSETKTGDLGELMDLPEDSPLKPAITSTTDNCLGQECEFYNECFVLQARRKAQEATLLVVNHHLLMADLALKETGFGELLPRAEVIIFDEAHQLPELAATFFGLTISSRQIIDLVNDARSAFLADAKDIKDVDQLMDTLRKVIQNFRMSLGETDRRESWGDLVKSTAIKAASRQLNQSLSNLERLLDKVSMRSKSLENCWLRTSTLLGQFKDYSERERDDQVQWLETRGNSFFLHQTPLDVSSMFKERINQHDATCIYTSATLAVKKDFGHFSRQLGLTECNTVALPSPFNYQQQALLYLPANLPEPGMPEYTRSVINTALPVIKASQGHTFLLFTSHRALREAGDILQARMEYPLLIQGQAPRTELLEEFRNTRHAVLLGTSSFWEGVDVKGDSLSSVIIDKLPFMPPDDPVFRARAEKMQASGSNPFMEYQLPQAIINLKQGIGRLIRDSSDYGVLTICDPRLLTKSYGKQVLASLPGMEITRDISGVEDFYSRH